MASNTGDPESVVDAVSSPDRNHEKRHTERPEPDRTNTPTRPQSGVSRREVLKGAGIVAGTALVATGPLAEVLEARQSDEDAPLTLDTVEYETLDAICARLIPTDESGPGAKEARAVRYIDRALGGALGSSHDAYTAGLSAVNTYARSSKGAPFLELSGADQDAVLTDLQENRATGFTGNPSDFFNMVRSHTIQGTFTDPFYGGNANFIGWDMIGYPGVRVAVPEQYQRMEGAKEPNHRSVYDYTMFSKGEV